MNNFSWKDFLTCSDSKYNFKSGLGLKLSVLTWNNFDCYYQFFFALDQSFVILI